MRRASVVQSSWDTRYRVDRVCCRAGTTGGGSKHVWTLRTSRSSVFVSDMLGGAHVRSCEQDMSQVWRSHELRE